MVAVSRGLKVEVLALVAAVNVAAVLVVVVLVMIAPAALINCMVVRIQRIVDIDCQCYLAYLQ